MVDHLPQNSAYGQAVADDEELAELATGRQGEWHPSIAEWSPEVELLAAVYDRLGDLLAVTVTARGKKPKLPKPWPRPRTAADRVRARKRKQTYDDIMAKLRG